MATVLLIEDNIKLNEINRRALEAAGHRVLAAVTLAEARAFLASEAPDVILLDIMLPDGDGIDFCAEIRSATNVHILFLTSKAEHEDRIRGLDTGGDDYITKPYRLEELLARVKVALRRRDMDAAKPPENSAYGPLSFDMVAQRAYLRGADIQLTPKEFALLLMLLRNGGRPVAKEALYETIWKQPMIGDGRALWKQISTLKAKLGAETGIEIVAARGEGYLLRFAPPK